MTLAVLSSCALIGFEVLAVRVEVHIGKGLPSFNVVGMPDTGVRESRERVRSAIISSGFDFPAARVTVNLAPADLPKDSGRFDLPIALGVLLASGQMTVSESQGMEARPAAVDQFVFAGELSLTGAVVPVAGALAIGMGVKQAFPHKTLLLPEASAALAAHVPNLSVLPLQTLQHTVSFLCEHHELEPVEPLLAARAKKFTVCMSEVQGQQHARFALELAASGGHSVLMCGPPGVGKSMLAQRLATLLPKLPVEQQLEVAVVHQQGAVNPDAFYLSDQAPFRSPHHTCTVAAMVGGGRQIKPGEISLAHRGVLFMDELPEFDRRVLESLREPLETGEVQIARANQRGRFPARFQLIAAMNPCPCGYLGHTTISCHCTPERIERYKAKLSGPLLDRIDLHVQLPYELLTINPVQPTETSEQIQRRVTYCRQRQYARQGCLNAQLPGALLEQHAALNSDAQRILELAMKRWAWSVRTVQRLRKIARTLADMQDKDHVLAEHVALAMRYRDHYSLKP